MGNIYQKLLQLFPDLVKKLKKDEVDGLLTNKKDVTYDLVPAEPENKSTFRFGINENDDNGSSLIISVNIRSKRAWLTYADNNFIRKEPYNHNENKLFTEERNFANLILEEWLNILKQDGYKTEWHEKDKLAPNSPQEEGKVQLTDRHIKAGFKQKHIDWINKHRKGLLLVPRTKRVINNTVSLEADAKKTAMRAGKRISRTGVIYYEGRSNRVDITKHGI